MSEPEKKEEGSEAPSTSTELRFLDPAKLRFARKGAALVLTVEGDAKPYEQVTVIRSLPLSHPDRFWSVRHEKNQEVGVIVMPRDLPAEQRELLDAEMRRRYMMPVILAIREIRERFETLDWSVDTDRGAWRFTTRQLRDTLLHPAPGRYILTDVEGNRFDVPDAAVLPPESQKLLQQFL